MASKEFMEEFIGIIKEEVAIWQMSSPKYKDHMEKQKSWERLLSKWKEVDRHATIDTVKRKYDALRACCRREISKINKKAQFNEVYVPTLWYFDKLKFLYGQRSSVEYIPPPNEKFNDNDYEEDERQKTNPLKRKSKSNDQDADCLTSPPNKIVAETPRNVCQAIATTWANDLEKMNPSQQLFAKRAISEILFEGQMGTLHRNSVQINNPYYVSMKYETNEGDEQIFGVED